MKRSWALAAIPAIASIVAIPGAVHADSRGAPPVIVVGAPSMTWDDVSAKTTPNLWKLSGDSSLGSLSVKAAEPVSCPDDGWLTLGAGNRATASDRHDAACASSGLTVRASPGGGAEISGFAAAYDDNVSATDQAALGALGDALRHAGSCVAAAGRDAVLGAADSSGTVTAYEPDVEKAASDSAFLRRCPVTLVAATASRLDNVAATVAAHAPPNTVLLVVGVSEDGDATRAHLHVAIAHGAPFGHGVLVSASTRRPPFVQLVDLAPTVLWLRGVDVPTSMIGQRWQNSPEPAATSAKVTQLSRLDMAAQRQAASIVPFWLTLVALTILGCAYAWWLARRGSAKWRWAALACTWCALLPVSSFLAGMVSWWSSPLPLLVLAFATLVAATVAARLAVAMETVIWRRGPFGLAAAVGTLTFVVIALDLVTGAHLQIFTPAGYSPLVAGRFAGIGNVGFGIFAAGALLSAAGFVEALGRRGWLRPRGPRSPATPVAAVGVVAVAVDGVPLWGSDVGGVLALVPAFAVLAWLVTGRRVSWRPALFGVLLAVALVGVLGVIDYLRPASSQTHLGRFVGDVLHGGAWGIVRRKALADLHLLGYSALTLLIPLLVVAAVWLVYSPPRSLRQAFGGVPVLRPVLVALLVMAVVGAVLNDSGIAIPALAALVVVPATSAVVAASEPARARAGEASVAPPELLR